MMATRHRALGMEESIQELIALLDQRFGVDTLWIFGSEARGQARADSDLDVAVLLRARPGTLEWLEAKAEAGLLVGRKVDLVDLERSSPLLAMQVLRHGRLMVDRNPSRRYLFVAAVPGRREDVLRMRRPIEQRLLQRVAHG
ncbi:MAG: nucleotidyltransferase domain-containing protein [bacterium]|nr:nucleotidyltransferase domain-containing protein [bacterium]